MTPTHASAVVTSMEDAESVWDWSAIPKFPCVSMGTDVPVVDPDTPVTVGVEPALPFLTFANGFDMTGKTVNDGVWRPHSFRSATAASGMSAGRVGLCVMLPS